MSHGMLSIHGAALRTACPAYHEFLLRYRPHTKRVYGVVEGKEDPSFYRGFISSRLPLDWTIDLLPAGRKQQVVEFYGLMDWKRFSKTRICFFLDRDLSDFIAEALPTDENVYVTDGYSIENDLVSVETAERVLSEVLGFGTLSTEELGILAVCLEQSLREFASAMACVMAQIVLWRREGKRPPLDAIKPSQMFELRAGVLTVRPSFDEEVLRLAHVAAKVGLPQHVEADVQQVAAALAVGGPLTGRIRGKYLLWFFVSFLLDIHSSATTVFPERAASPKASVSMGTGNAVVLIGPRARCPHSLSVFIEGTYCAFVSGEPAS